MRFDEIINNNITMSKSCPAGKIRRKGYTTKRGTKVSATCTKNMGAPGKTPSSKKVLPKLKEVYLSKYGYIVFRRMLLKEKLHFEKLLKMKET